MFHWAAPHQALQWFTGLGKWWCAGLGQCTFLSPVFPWFFFFYCRLTCFQIQICRMWPTVPSVTEECLMGLWWHWWRKVNSHCERLARHFDALERPCLSSSHSSLSVLLSVSQPQEFPCPSSSTLHRFFTSFHFYTLGCSIVFIGSQECLCDFWPWALRTKSIRVCQHRFI